MSLTQKLTLAILALLCTVLALGGSWTLGQNFRHSLAQAEQQATYAHLRAQLGLEDALESNAETWQLVQSAQAYARAAGATGSDGGYLTVLKGDGMVVWSNMPPATISFAVQWAAVQDDGGLRYHSQGGAWHVVLASPLQGQDGAVYVVTAIDVTPYFAEHWRQLRQYLVLQVTALALAGAAAFFTARRLTRPLRQLQDASQAIAAGQYSGRVPVHGHDEVAALAHSFNGMAQAVQQNTRALEQEAARQTRFVAAFTHELKTPMTAILGYADLLRSGEQDPALRRREAEYIYRESARLEQLSRELLALLGLQQGAAPAMAPMPVAALFEDVRRIFADAAVLQFACPPGAAVIGNRVLLGDLLCNLVRNALAASQQGAPIRLSCTPAGACWRLAVQDAGLGIAPEDLPHVTEAFYMADKSRTRAGGGSGLGLTLCAQIAHAHGCKLHIKSAVGKGTTVWLEVKAV